MRATNSPSTVAAEKGRGARQHPRQPVAGLRALDRDQSKFRARLQRAVEAAQRQDLPDPRQVLGGCGGVDDQPERPWTGRVGDQVVEDSAIVSQHAAVQCTALDQAADVIGEQQAQEIERRRPCEIDDPHVRDVEHSGVAPHRVMFIDLGAVVQRHVPSAEVDHPRARGAVNLVKRRALEHFDPGIEKGARRTLDVRPAPNHVQMPCIDVKPAI